MFALILDSLGSTELLFILIVALIFFGPRKLPQLSRSLGRSLAEFRKASEDFKRTWEREVVLESTRAEAEPNSASLWHDDSAPGPAEQTDPLLQPSVAPLPAERVIAHKSSRGFAESSERQIEHSDSQANSTDPESLPKRDWL